MHAVQVSPRGSCVTYADGTKHLISASGWRVPGRKEPVASATEGQRAIRVAMGSTLATGHSALTYGSAARVAVVTVDWLLPDS